MVSVVQVVRLSETEKQALSAASSASSAKRVGDEVSAALKVGDDAVKLVASSREVSRDDLVAAERTVAARLELLDQLPAGERRDEYLAETTLALEVIREGLGLFGS